MIFKKIRFKNLFSYGKTWTEMDLDCNETINIVGVNGTGKSTVVEAIFFALTGKTLRKVKKDTIVNFKNKKNCLVELTVAAGNHTYFITRGAKPNVFTIEKDGEPLDEAAQMVDTQTYLETALGYNKKNLKHTLIMSTTDYTPFLRLAAADKRLFIEDILAIEVFTIMNNLIKAKLSILKEDIKDAAADIDKAQYKLNMVLEHNKLQRKTNDEEIKGLRTDIENEKAAWVQKIADYDAKIAAEIEWEKNEVADCATRAAGEADKLKTRIADLENKINLANAAAKQCQALAAQLKVDIDGKKAKHAEIGVEKAAIYKEMCTHIEKYEADKSKYQKGLDKGSQVKFKQNIKLDTEQERLAYYTETAECDKCGQKVHDDFKAAQIADINETILNLQARIAKVKGELEKVAKFKTKIDAFKANKIDPLDKKCKDLEKVMSDYHLGWVEDESSLKVADNDARTRDREAKQAQYQIDEAKKDTAARIAELEGPAIDKLHNEADERVIVIERDHKRASLESDGRIGKHLDKIKELESEKRGNFKDEKAPKKGVADALAKQKALDFKKLVHDTAILILSDKGIKTYIVRRYLPKLNTLVNKYLEILGAPYKLMFDADLTESILLKGYDKLGYNNFSEGEKQRADVALLFAFLDIAKAKNSATSNLLIMDEVFDRSLDDDGIRGIVDILSSMKSRGFTIVNISHKHQLADQFDKTFMAVKQAFSELKLYEKE